jgi:hypothetical protein
MIGVTKAGNIGTMLARVTAKLKVKRSQVIKRQQ